MEKARVCTTGFHETMFVVYPRISRFDLAIRVHLQLLPADIRSILADHPDRAELLEVVLDLGRKPEVRD